jgi:hypothetical protein
VLDYDVIGDWITALVQVMHLSQLSRLSLFKRAYPVLNLDYVFDAKYLNKN